MILLSTSTAGNRPSRTTVILGLGLIGGAISSFLLAHGFVDSVPRSSPWQDPGALYRQLTALGEQEPLNSARCIDWVWAAGASGFAASELECSKELEVFTAFVDAAERIRDKATAGTRMRFHLVSSAGGLYEGQRLVANGTQPAPVRAYGRLKLRQEQLGADRFGTLDTFVYRLSSVYGYIRPGKRLGLVTTLLGNTLRQQTTVISGQLDTLRDYLWIDDAAEYIGRGILSDDGSTGSPCVLASSRPSSIYEIRSIVQSVTKRPSYIHCAKAENAEHITFARSVLPAGFAPSMIETCISRILVDTMTTGGVWPGETSRLS